MRVSATLVLVAVVAVTLLCTSVSAGDFRYIPVLQVTAQADQSGCQYVVEQKCRDAGAYIAADVTDSLKTAIGNAVTSAGFTGEWFTFLGADTLMDGNTILDYNRSAKPLPLCTPDTEVLKASGENGAITPNKGCVWRWNTGRWRYVEDIYYPESAISYLGTNAYTYTGLGFGVAFMTGNSFRVMADLPNEFPTRFNYQDTATQIAPDCTSKDCYLRPNFFQGQQLMAVGNGADYAWSDGRSQGGYPYTQIEGTYVYDQNFASEVTINSGEAATLNKHIAVCIMYAPVAADKELYDTSSKLQELWWVIYLVFAFLICLVVFIVAACCQEREDMDEPPEDAPEWARQDVAGVQRSKVFVSQRNMQSKADDYSDPEKYEEMDPVKSTNPLLGPGGRRGSRRQSTQAGPDGANPDYYPVNTMNQGAYPTDSGYNPGYNPDYNQGYAPVPQNNNWV